MNKEEIAKLKKMGAGPQLIKFLQFILLEKTNTSEFISLLYAFLSHEINEKIRKLQERN